MPELELAPGVSIDIRGMPDHETVTRALHRAVPARVNGMLLLSGGDHGVDLLADKHAGQVRSWIEHFLSVLSIRNPG